MLELNELFLEVLMDIKFNDIKELYARLEPALNAKVAELNRKGINYIKKEDVWNYLKAYKWRKANNLLLYQMVDDILNTDYILLDNYVKDSVKLTRVRPNLDSEGLYE
jgi:hypothetical protein